MRYNKEHVLLYEDQGNANALKYDFRTLYNLLTPYGLTKYGSKIIFLNFPFSVAILEEISFSEMLCSTL